MIHAAAAEGVHRVEDAYTNWYVIEDGGALTVVDTGHPRSWRSLQELLQRLGRDAGSIEAVVLTHAHFDHMGFAERARKELGVPVYAHERELPVTKHPWRYDHERSRIPYMLRHPGFDRAFFAMAAMGALWVKGLSQTLVYSDGQELDVPGRPRVVFTPGHTYGHCALFLADRGVLLAGDALVTYNPYRGSSGPQIVSGAATADSAQALASLDSLAALDAHVVLTGPGEPGPPGPRGAVDAGHRRGRRARARGRPFLSSVVRWPGAVAPGARPLARPRGAVLHDAARRPRRRRRQGRGAGRGRRDALVGAAVRGRRVGVLPCRQPRQAQPGARPRAAGGAGGRAAARGERRPRGRELPPGRRRAARRRLLGARGGEPRPRLLLDQRLRRRPAGLRLRD